MPLCMTRVGAAIRDGSTPHAVCHDEVICHRRFHVPTALASTVAIACRRSSSTPMVDPIGEGRTSRGAVGSVSNTDGDSERADGESGRVDSSRATAKAASWSQAKASAPGPFHRYGKSLMPRSTATHTGVEKLRTSATTARSASTAPGTDWTPIEPHCMAVLAEQGLLIRRTHATCSGFIEAICSPARSSARSSS